MFLGFVGVVVGVGGVRVSGWCQGLWMVLGLWVVYGAVGGVRGCEWCQGLWMVLGALDGVRGCGWCQGLCVGVEGGRWGVWGGSGDV